jgi:hypothetical protein
LVHQPGNPFPRRQFSGRVLFIDARLAAALFELHALCAQVGQLLGHGFYCTLCLLRHPYS